VASDEVVHEVKNNKPVEDIVSKREFFIQCASSYPIQKDSEFIHNFTFSDDNKLTGLTKDSIFRLYSGSIGCMYSIYYIYIVIYCHIF
jgi:hypothetical protein